MITILCVVLNYSWFPSIFWFFLQQATGFLIRKDWALLRVEKSWSMKGYDDDGCSNSIFLFNFYLIEHLPFTTITQLHWTFPRACVLLVSAAQRWAKRKEWNTYPEDIAKKTEKETGQAQVVAPEGWQLSVLTYTYIDRHSQNKSCLGYRFHLQSKCFQFGIGVSITT